MRKRCPWGSTICGSIQTVRLRMQTRNFFLILCRQYFGKHWSITYLKFSCMSRRFQIWNRFLVHSHCPSATVTDAWYEMHMRAINCESSVGISVKVHSHGAKATFSTTGLRVHSHRGTANVNFIFDVCHQLVYKLQCNFQEVIFITVIA